ncbi:adenylate/guanylate cyclase domain-containing protein [Oscillatoria laete-virens NRMC-F 0139]|nr:adenylate/guanylate cyclase domain-containing protein [Oscillatoria laete-virens]MDL5055789.1 adenylate/guanylate cyclase domain-containing protein [Oscillatoria laete-virens NRMC-F 0139]
MPGTPSEVLPDHAKELQRLRGVAADVLNGLRRQSDLLRLRGIAPPPALLENLIRLDASLDVIAQTLAGDDAEISQLRALAKTYALINSSLDADTVLGQAMDEIIRLTGAERGFMLMNNPATNTIEFRIARGMDADGATEEVSRTILRQVLDTGKPILTENATNDPNFFRSETVARYHLRSVLCVPMVFRERIEGAIYVDNRFRDGVFTEKELTLLTAFANQTAVAVNNALLFEQVQATLREITQARDLMENVFESIDSGVITADAADRVTTFNHAAGLILGIPPDRAIGKPLLEVLPRIRDDFDAYLRTVRERRQRAALEAKPEISGRGTAILNLRLSPLQTASDENGEQAPGVAMVIEDLTEQREREETLDLLRRYLPPGMLENIQQIADLAMGGERREVTCVFMYPCQYAQFPADLRPRERMQLLNVYLQVATDIIQQAQGVIDKYMGSEIMILFNTQLNPQSDHALRAVEMALAMRSAYHALYEQLGIRPEPDQYCIGIHTGVATMGNVGSHQRRNFTAIGDTINLTKRLQEGASPGQIILSGETLDHIQAQPVTERTATWRFVERGVFAVRGRQQETRIYEVFDR